MINPNRRAELRESVAVMIDLAWRSGEWAGTTGLESLEDLPPEEHRYVSRIVERAIKAAQGD